MHDIIPFLFLTAFLIFITWSVVRAREWERRQADAARRSKALFESASSDRGKLDESLSLSREHLQVTKELLVEIKALRADLKKDR